MSDPAKLMYDQLNDETDLQQFISQEVENLYLDYKTKRDHNSPEVDRDLQENLSKALSGFANSDSGVLVIGVDSRDGQPNTIKPILPIVDFEQAVNTYIPRSTSFLVQGVTVKNISTTSAEGTPNGGVIVIYIPKNDLAPHCHMKSKKYYQRNGDSFVAMEHYQVADAFGKRSRPHLVPYARVQRDNNSTGRIEIILGIDNLGRAIARHPYFKLIDLAGFQISAHGVSGTGHFGLHCYPNPTNYRNYRGGADDVIHPGAPLDVTKLRCSFQRD